MGIFGRRAKPQPPPPPKSEAQLALERQLEVARQQTSQIDETVKALQRQTDALNRRLA